MNHRKITAMFLNLALAFGIAITTLSAQAAVPSTLSYQGNLQCGGGAGKCHCKHDIQAV